uniref:ubiquitin carboxyl-terminal hydrolase family protein n=2 Tax=Candidatus Cardinium TaxID=273135 RepID=UPI001FAA1F6C
SSSSSSFSSGSASSGFSSGSSSSGSYTPSTPPPPPPSTPTPFAGLTNVVNSCYMNAVLQVIAALYSDSVKHQYLKTLIEEINNGHRPLGKDRMERVRTELLQLIDKTVDWADKQQDVDEFLLLLHQKLNYPFLQSFNTFERTIISVTKNHDCCNYYKQISQGPYNLLYVNFPESCVGTLNLTDMIASCSETVVHNKDVKLKVCLNDYHRLNNENQSNFLRNNQDQLEVIDYSNSSNDIEVGSYIKQVIYREPMPSRLCVELMRYDQNLIKNNSDVNGTFDMTIKPDPNNINRINYNLNAFIVHDGDSTSSGHYIAYVKRKDQWYEVSDNNVKEITQSDAINKSKQAYLLFYKKQ